MKKEIKRKSHTKKPKRTLSSVKKKTIKQAKDTKKGLLKPKLTSTYLIAQNKRQQAQKEAPPKLTQEDHQANTAAAKEREDEVLDQLVQEMDEKEMDHVIKASRKRGRGNDDDSDDFDELLEEGALNRIEKEDKESKKVKPMLPYLTKSGWKARTIIEEGGEEEGEEEVEQEDQDGEEDGQEEVLEDIDEQTKAGEQVSVIELYARRKALLHEKKMLIGTLASTFLESPEQKMSNLDNLVKLVDAPQPDSIQMSIQRLAAASVLEVLKDVTPGYRIFHQDQDKGDVRQKKEVRGIQDFENGILKAYKSFLLKLEIYVNYFKAGKKKALTDAVKMKQAELYLSFMCELLVAHPTFNFSFNILHAIIPVLDARQSSARLIVRQTLEKVFKGDMKGEISYEACRLINHLVKSRKHYVNMDAIDVLRSLRIKDVNLDKEKEKEMEISRKESNRQKLMEKNHISRVEKKRRKKLMALDKELLEAKGEESKQTKQKHFTEATKLVFTIYFRVLKSHPKSVLLGSVLEGLAKFAHIINIQFFSDLIIVFQSLLQEDFLTNRDGLLLVNTVFTILSGQGEALNIDPASFYTHLYNILFIIDPVSSHNDLPLALKSLNDMIVKRKKRVSKARVLAFAKRLSTLALQLLHNGSVAALVQLREIVIAHTVTHQLLDSQYEVGSGIFDPSINNPEHCSASNTTAWELSLLTRHYHPPTTKLAKHISALCPQSGELSIPQEWKKPATEIFSDFSMDEMAFNPSIKPPAAEAKGKKRKRGDSTPVTLSTETLESPECDENIDFYAALNVKT